MTDELLSPLSEPAALRRERSGTIGINGKPFFFAESMREHCAEVFHDEYALCAPLDETRKWVPRLPKGPSVLDIGANCGAFSVWAFYAYAPSIIHAYEPHPEAWEYFCKNAKNHGLGVEGAQAAVTGITAKGGKLWRGLHNLGESTMIRQLGHEDSDAIDVDIIQPCEIPACNIIKVDTEGDEVFILRTLDLSAAEIITVEFHSASDEREIRDFLAPGFQLFSGYHRNPSTGVLRFRRIHEENPQP